MIVRDATRDHYGWIAQRASVIPGSEFRAIEAVDAEGRIHGMVGLCGWTGNAVYLHIALDNPAALRSLVRAGFDAAFRRAGKGLALAAVLSTNARSLALVKHLGFRETYRLRDGWEVGVDMVLHEMRREECRWIQQEERAAWAA